MRFIVELAISDAKRSHNQLSFLTGKIAISKRKKTTDTEWFPINACFIYDCLFIAGLIRLLCAPGVYVLALLWGCRRKFLGLCAQYGSHTQENFITNFVSRQTPFEVGVLPRKSNHRRCVVALVPCDCWV